MSYHSDAFVYQFHFELETVLVLHCIYFISFLYFYY